MSKRNGYEIKVGDRWLFQFPGGGRPEAVAIANIEGRDVEVNYLRADWVGQGGEFSTQCLIAPIDSPQAQHLLEQLGLDEETILAPYDETEAERPHH